MAEIRKTLTSLSPAERAQLSSKLSSRRVRSLLMSGAAGPFAASLLICALLLLGKEVSEWARAHPGAFDVRTLRAAALLLLLASIFAYLKWSINVKPRTARLERTAVAKND